MNGVFRPEREAGLSIFDSGLMYGDIAFEMTRTFHGRPFRLGEHLERLYGSLRLLEIDCGLPLEAMERRTLETFARNAATESADVDWHIRHDVSRGPLPLYASVFTPVELEPTVIISCWPLIKSLARVAPLYETGVDVFVSAQHALPATLIDPNAKTRSRVHFQLAQLEAQRRGKNAWPVLTDPDGFLTEGPSWNIFLVKNGTLLTPRSTHILHGVSRAVTMEVADALGIGVTEADLDVEAARTADEIFCTATSFGLLFAATFEGRPVSSGQPGPVYQKLSHGWKEAVGLDFVAQARSYAERASAWEARERAAVAAGSP